MFLGIVGMVFSLIIIPIFRLGIKIIVFTGAWIAFFLAFLLLQVQGYLHLTPNTIPFIVFNYAGGVISLLPMVVITIQNTIRMVTRNQQFNMFGSLWILVSECKSKKKSQATKSIEYNEWQERL